MNIDEQSIRDLVSTWHTATAAGDVEAVLSLMTEDVVFLRAGQPPMKGRSAFEKGLRALLQANDIESMSEVQEVGISGPLAYCWSVLRVQITPKAGGKPVVRTGSAVSILRKQVNGTWAVVRDANMLAELSKG
ncbi:MAG: SgcJ/EcaC family oxidoreductase [Pseudomonadota bacterium]